MRANFRSAAPLLFLVLQACSVFQPHPPALQRSQLELRQLQTRDFQGAELKQGMKAMLDVLQDDGFIVKNAVVELGLLSAVKEVDLLDPNEVFWQSLFMGQEARWKRNSVVEVTVNVREIAGGIRIRANFQAKTLDNVGGVVEVKNIEEPQFYREFFSKVDKGLFLSRQRI